MMRGTFVLLLLLMSARAFATTINAASVSRADVGTANSACVSGDTLVIPAGSANWTTGIVWTPGITIQGAGSGGIIARSTDTVTIGTGTKVFTVVMGSGSTSQTFTGGQGVTVMAVHNGDEQQMVGTVTSYAAPTLTLNITSTVSTSPGGSTWAAWVFRVAAQTTIINDVTAETFMMQLTPSSDTEMSGIWFREGTTTRTHFEIYEAAGAAKIHHCQFSTNAGINSISLRTNHGIIYNCSFDCGLYSGTGIGPQTSRNTAGIVCRPDTYTPTSWNTVSTMGTSDTTGRANFYIEDNRFTGMLLQAADFEGNSRSVFRHNLLDNSATTSHGQDSSPSGLRYVEIYDNDFVRDLMGAGDIFTYPMSYLFFIRGGTAVIADNVIPDLTTNYWGAQKGVVFSVFNIRLAFAAICPCQTAYPASRQPGRGYVDGTGPDFAPYTNNPDNTFKGDLEPIYIWGNTGGGNYDTPGFSNTTDSCGNGLLSSDFILADRDYYTSTTKPGYTKYTYPHPLRGGGGGGGGSSTGSRKVGRGHGSLGGRAP